MILGIYTYLLIFPVLSQLGIGSYTGNPDNTLPLEGKSVDSNYGSKNRSMPGQINGETDLSTDYTCSCSDFPLDADEWRAKRLSRNAFMICRAYDEPRTCCTVENILMGRKYIID